jgi:hypothetical protein
VNEDQDRLMALLTDAGLFHLLEKLLHAHSSLVDASTRAR